MEVELIMFLVGSIGGLTSYLVLTRKKEPPKIKLRKFKGPPPKSNPTINVRPTTNSYLRSSTDEDGN